MDLNRPWNLIDALSGPLPLEERLLRDLKSMLGEEAFAAAWAQGEAMDVDEEFEKEFADWLHGDHD